MNKIVEIIALALGGLSLFAVCYTGFAVLSGVPADEVAVIGRFFDAPKHAPGGKPDVPRRRAPERKPDQDVLKSNLGILGSWSLPSPYTAEELKRLADELKAKSFGLEQRDAELDERQRRIDEQIETLAERFETLEWMRSDLDAFESSLALRAQEVQRDESADQQRTDRRWKDVATILTSLEGQAAHEFIAEYPPEEAARILRNLSDAQAAEFLAGLRSVPSVTNWKAYVDAYSLASAEPGS